MSSAAAAWRCSLRKASTRSRASGGSCGDSVAATSALTMSSLRRRAIWMQRARSIARSSTGGRASARTTAPASPGSTSSRSQASTSRTSARPKNAAAPARRKGSARSSSATASSWPSLRTRAHEHADRARRRMPSRTSRSIVGGDGLGLGALVGAAPQRARRPARRALDVGADRAEVDRSAIGATTASAATITGRGQRRLRASRTTSTGVRRSARRAAPAAATPTARGSSMAWSSSAVAIELAVLGGQQQRRPAPGPGVRSSRSSTRTWRPAAARPRAHVRALLEQLLRAQHAARRSRAAPCSRSSRSWASIQAGELALALGRARRRRAARRPTRRSAPRARPSSLRRSIRAMTPRRARRRGPPRRSWRRSVSSSTRSSSSARRSAGVAGTANGSMPASSASSRSRRAHRPGIGSDRQLLERPVAQRVLDPRRAARRPPRRCG